MSDCWISVVEGLRNVVQLPLNTGFHKLPISQLTKHLTSTQNKSIPGLLEGQPRTGERGPTCVSAVLKPWTSFHRSCSEGDRMLIIVIINVKVPSSERKVIARRRASERANAGIRMYVIEWSFSICCQVKMKQVHTARKQLAEDPAGGKKPKSYRQRLTTLSANRSSSGE